MTFENRSLGRPLRFKASETLHVEYMDSISQATSGKDLVLEVKEYSALEHQIQIQSSPHASPTPPNNCRLSGLVFNCLM